MFAGNILSCFLGSDEDPASGRASYGPIIGFSYKKRIYYRNFQFDISKLPFYYAFNYPTRSLSMYKFFGFT